MTNFKYPMPSDPVFAELWAEAGLKVGAGSSFEGALQVMGYAHTLFEHDGDNTPSSFDALTILREAKAGEQFRCVEYSILAQGLLWAYSIPARVIGLKTVDVETREYGAGHVVVEFWDTEAAKWIMCDVQWGVVPKLSGEYLTAFEFGSALNQGKTVEYAAVEGSRFTSEKTTEYTDWIREYLYFYDTDLQVFHAGPYHDLAGELKLMLVPKGVQPPEMFEGLFKMNLQPTTDPLDFYPNYIQESRR